MKVFPVVHLNDYETALRQSELALSSGADGVYLIDHVRIDPALTFSVFNGLDEQRPESYIGMNLLGYSSIAALGVIRRACQNGLLRRAPDGLWVDDARRAGRDTPESVMSQKNADPELSRIRLLGGVAFKYTSTYTDDPIKAQRETESLLNAVDVVTTSGSGTGSPPSVEKLRAMHAVSNKPIAVASGISEENIGDYEGLVDEILVASSVETEPYSGVFDQEKLRRIIDAAHQLRLMSQK